MNRRRRPARSLLLALLLALAGAGCSGSGDPPPAGGAAAPPATTEAPATTTAAPVGPSTTAAPAPVRYRYPVAGCRATYGQHSGYPAADMFTGRGCAFVAPVAGRVDEVTRTDTWRQASDRGADRGGRSVLVVGVDVGRY